MDDSRKRLKEIRIRTGLNQSQFALKMGVKRNTWANIESGVNPLSERYVNLVCLTFQVTKEWLLTGKGAIFESNPVAPSNMEKEDRLLDKSTTSELTELLSIYQELVPLNQKAVMDFLETTLRAQRNTMKALKAKDQEE